MRIIIIGFGSIGKRHHSNLLNLGYKNIAVFDPNSQLFKDGSIKQVKKMTIKSLSDYDLAFICSPNNLHIKHALLCAQAGCHLFIEKPLSHSLSGIKKLQALVKKHKLINMVACNLRFHPCLDYIKLYLSQNKLGKIFSISHEFGYYLPDWRPGADYKANYASKKETGGGIILDDIHEFDLLMWLNNFNQVLDYKFFYNKASNLKIETEDNCIAIFKFANAVLGTVKCDYLQKSYTRKCKIVGEKGNIRWDFKDNIVWLAEKDKSIKLFETKRYDINRMYISEIKYFLKCVKEKKQTSNSLDRAEKVLKYCIKRK